MARILADFERIILPGVTHWNHPSFFAYFAITGSAPGILGEMLTAAPNVNGMLCHTSPSATELEQVVLDWLRHMLGLPAGFWGMMTDTASVSSMTALAAAREALNLGIREQGMDYGIQLGRRFRSLKLWFVLRYFGQTGLAERLAQHIALAQDLAAWVDASPDWERLAPTPFSTVCFRACPASFAHDEAALEQFNAALEERINATGQAFLSPTRLHGRYALRLAIGYVRTTPAHIAQVWDLLNHECRELLGTGR